MSNIRSRISRNDIAAERAEAIQVRLSAGHDPFLVPYSTFCPSIDFSYALFLFYFTLPLVTIPVL